jgi:hypothetical protein
MTGSTVLRADDLGSIGLRGVKVGCGCDCDCDCCDSGGKVEELAGTDDDG